MREKEKITKVNGNQEGVFLAELRPSNLKEVSGKPACADPKVKELFFGLDGERSSMPKVQERETAAKEVCKTCPIKTACLNQALSKPEMYGVWGGMGEKERERLLRLRAQARRQEAAETDKILIDKAKEKELIHLVIKALPDEDQELVHTAYIAGVPRRQIAADGKMTMGQLKSRLDKARAEIKKHYMNLGGSANWLEMLRD